MAGLRWHDWLLSVGQNGCFYSSANTAWHYLTCSGRPKDLAKGQAPDRGARRHAAKGVRRLVERRGALLARGVHNNKANVATARELACWVWAVGLMAEEA